MTSKLARSETSGGEQPPLLPVAVIAVAEQQLP